MPNFNHKPHLSFEENKASTLVPEVFVQKASAASFFHVLAKFESNTLKVDLFIEYCTSHLE